MRALSLVQGLRTGTYADFPSWEKEARRAEVSPGPLLALRALNPAVPRGTVVPSGTQSSAYKHRCRVAPSAQINAFPPTTSEKNQTHVEFSHS